MAHDSYPLIRVVLLAALALPACGGGAPDQEASASTANVSSGPAEPGAVDACRLVTEDEASSLFGKPASRGKGTLVVDPAMIGECLWEYDTPTANQLLQVRVWSSARYYSAPRDEWTTPFDLGEKGYLRVHPGAGVDAVWVQGGRSVEVSYSTVGSAGDPQAVDRVEAVKALARRAAGRL